MKNKKKPNEMSFGDFKKIINLFKKDEERCIRLMGGEPTLHSKFKEIVDYSLNEGFLVQIFTNGIFNNDILEFLLSKKDLIKYSFNLNHPNKYDKKTWELINRNIKELSVFKKVLVGGVVSDKNFNIDYLVEIADKNKIINIALRPDNTVDKNKDIAKTIIREIKKVDKKKFNICYGCGLSKDDLTDNQIKLIESHCRQEVKYGCDGNSGRFDIDVDLSVFRCFPLSKWHVKKIDDFNNLEEIEEYFNSLIRNNKVNCALIE